MKGDIKVDIHYYEDGNVRLLSEKSVSTTISSSSSSSSSEASNSIVKAIGAAEKKFQEELNSSFTNLSEGAFKSLRRQLPVTRQKIEWEKISSYRVSTVSCCGLCRMEWDVEWRRVVKCGVLWLIVGDV